MHAYVWVYAHVVIRCMATCIYLQSVRMVQACQLSLRSGP